METNNRAVLASSILVFKEINDDIYDNMESISVRLLYELRKSKISYPMLSGLANCSRDTIAKYINQIYDEDIMNVDILKRIAIALDKDKYYFCNYYHKFRDKNNIGAMLRARRSKYGYNQKEFALILNISLYQYKSYEQNKVKTPIKILRNIDKIEYERQGTETV